MRRLLKIVLLTVTAFFGTGLTILGAHLWSAAQRSVSTIFETMTRGEDSGLICGNIDWVDKEFLLHRTAAAVILLFGVSTLFWVVVFLLKRDDHDWAT
jgi:hypothetical protein